MAPGGRVSCRYSTIEQWISYSLGVGELKDEILGAQRYIGNQKHAPDHLEARAPLVIAQL